MNEVRGEMMISACHRRQSSEFCDIFVNFSSDSFDRIKFKF